MGLFTYAAARSAARQSRAARLEAKRLRWQVEEESGVLADETTSFSHAVVAAVSFAVGFIRGFMEELRNP